MDYRFTRTDKPFDPIGWERFADSCRKVFGFPGFGVTFRGKPVHLYVVTPSFVGEIREYPSGEPRSADALMNAIYFTPDDEPGLVRLVGNFEWGETNGAVVASLVGVLLCYHLPGHYTWQVVAGPNGDDEFLMDNRGLQKALETGMEMAMYPVDDSMALDMDNRSAPYEINIHFGDEAHTFAQKAKKMVAETGRGRVEKLASPTDSDGSLLSGLIKAIGGALGLDDDKLDDDEEVGDPNVILQEILDAIPKEADLVKSAGQLIDKEAHAENWRAAHGTKQEVGNFAGSVTRHLYDKYSDRGYLHCLSYMSEAGGMVVVDLSRYGEETERLTQAEREHWVQKFVRAGFKQGAGVVTHTHQVRSKEPDGSWTYGFMTGVYRPDEGLVFAGVVPMDSRGKLVHALHVDESGIVNGAVPMGRSN